MITFYSIPKLLKASNNNVDKILALIKDKKFKGDSYLLNLDKLLGSIATNFHKAEYVYLASFRNYADYALLGIDFLDLSLIPDINISTIRSNTLISIENNKIIFKKEL